MESSPCSKRATAQPKWSNKCLLRTTFRLRTCLPPLKSDTKKPRRVPLVATCLIPLASITIST